MPPKGSKNGGKAKKVKDPNAPKRPLSAYFLFMNVARPQVKKENPDFKIGDIAKEMGKMWGVITPAEKSKYEKEAAGAKKKWEAEKAAYEQSGGGKNVVVAEVSEEEGEDSE
jgi:hypothetical protein